MFTFRCDSKTVPNRYFIKLITQAFKIYIRFITDYSFYLFFQLEGNNDAVHMRFSFK